LQKIHPKLLQIVNYVAVFCKENGIKFVITSAIRSKDRNTQVKSKSVTHVEGRAIDFSIKERWGWSPDLVWAMTIKVNKMYKQFGAFTNRPEDKQVVLFNHSVNPNEGTHIHLQVYRGLPWKY
jgi:ribosomal protein L31